MKYYMDCEFHEYHKQVKVAGIKVGKPIPTIDLISIGIVSETIEGCKSEKYSGRSYREYYAICKDFNLKDAWGNNWLRENVLKPIMVDLVNEFGRDKFNKTLSEENRKVIENRGVTYKFFKKLINKYGKTKKEIAEDIINFVGYQSNSKFSDIEFYAYYADYDWVVFCQLWSSLYPVKPKLFETGMSYMNPKGFPYYCKDLQQILEDISFTDMYYSNDNLTEHSDYPKQDNEHNALDDAKWNKQLHEFLNNI